MEKITELLDTLKDLEKLIPKLDTLMDWVQWLISFAVRIGPLCILILGLIHLLIPPKEANHKAGFRTYFGMGSVEAWMFTQRVSGAIMTVVGLILLLIAKGAVKNFAGMDTMEMAEKAFRLVKGQIICALVIYVFMFLLTAVMFNHKGIPRFGKTKFAPKKPVQEELPDTQPEELPEQIEMIEEEIPEVEYERQGEQVITADDIVIEGLDE